MLATLVPPEVLSKISTKEEFVEYVQDAEKTTVVRFLWKMTQASVALLHAADVNS